MKTRHGVVVALAASCCGGCLLVAEPPELTDVAPEQGWVDLVVAADGICALDDEGRVWCGEPGDLGLLDAGPFDEISGSGTLESIESICVRDPGGLVRCGGWDGAPGFELIGYFDGIAGDVRAGCAFTYGEAACWPESNVPPRHGFAVVGVGAHGACGLATDSSAPECWGFDDQFEYGLVGEATDLRLGHVAVDDEVACGVTPGGVLACWGFGADAYSLDPVPAGGFIDVAIDDDVACAVSDFGVVMCWGNGAFAHGRGVPPLRVRFTDIEMEGTRVCGIDDETRLHCW